MKIIGFPILRCSACMATAIGHYDMVGKVVRMTFNHGPGCDLPRDVIIALPASWIYDVAPDPESGSHPQA